MQKNGFAIVDDVISKIGSEDFYKHLEKSGINSFSKRDFNCLDKFS